MSCENGDKKAECCDGARCNDSSCPQPEAGCKSLEQVFDELLRPFRAAASAAAYVPGLPNPVVLNFERATCALAREFGFDPNADLFLSTDPKTGELELAVDRSAFDKAGRVPGDAGSWRDGASAALDVEDDYGDEPYDDEITDVIRYIADFLDARLAADEERLMEHATNATGLASLALEKLPDLPSEKYAELVHDAVRAAMVGYVDGIDYLRGDAYADDVNGDDDINPGDV